MRSDLPWNVAGVPPEAREAARVAARREGLSVGEWLTRRILHSLADIGPAVDDDVAFDDPLGGGPRRPEPDEGLIAAPPREFDAEGVCHRIEGDLRALAQRIENTERSQAEGHRAANRAAAEMNVASREHTRAVDEFASNVKHLSLRIERVERQIPSEGLRDAVRGLHQGLTRLADQMSQATSHSADQISALADKLEGVARQLGQTTLETDSVARRLEVRTTQIDERMQALERRIELNASEATRAAESALAVARLEESLARVEARTPDPALDRRLNGIERALADVKDRSPVADPRQAIEDQLRALAERIESGENRQRETASELRRAIEEIPRIEAHDQTPTAPRVEDRPTTTPPVLDASPAPSNDFPHNVPRPSDTPEALMPSASPVEQTPALAEDQTPALQALNEPLSPLQDSFLAAARRSAQAAAAQAEAERAGKGFGGFAWNTRAEPVKRRSPRFAHVGLVILAVALLTLGVLNIHRLITPTPRTNGVSARLADKGAFAVAKLRARSTAGAPSSVDRASPSAPDPVPAPNASKSPPSDAPAGQSASMARKPERPAATADSQGAVREGALSARQAETGAPPVPTPHHLSVAALDRVTALANLGNARAETIVGLRYLEGDGTPPNESEAVKWLARAAEHGEAVAQYRLATLYEHGRGVPTDLAKAIHWYQLAAQAGNRKAMHNLAVAYAQGTGVSKDFFEAARWFSKAAALGLADSQFNLAVLYERGLGVPQSLMDAYKWYAIAATQGDAESKVRIDAIATQLRAEDRAAAQRSADQFRPAQLNAAANVPPQLNDIAG